nr:MAG TPA: Cytosine specific methyltransferase [Caudoviricetes sp.]
MSRISLATIFSGIGAPEFAAREVFDEVETVFACEIDKYARQSYLANHEIDEARFFADVKELDARPYAGQIDILIGGSPCQDFSIAGLHAGVCGSRGSLVWEYLRVLSQCKPRVFVFENVKGLISVSHTSAFYAMMEEFRRLGYYCHAQIANTKDYGIPQNRERLYIVGFLDEDEYYAFSYAPETGCGKLADYLDRDVNEKYFLSDKALAYFHSKHPKFNGKFEPRNENEGVATTITTNPGHRRTDTFIKVVGELDAKGNESIRRVYDTCGIAPTLTTATGGGHTPKILQKTRGLKQGCALERNNPLKGERIRKLTPRECLRLQGFPESFKIVVSDTQVYKQAGNAMSVNVIKMIFWQIQKAKIGQFKLVG